MPNESKAALVELRLDLEQQIENQYNRTATTQFHYRPLGVEIKVLWPTDKQMPDFKQDLDTGVGVIEDVYRPAGLSGRPANYLVIKYCLPVTMLPKPYITKVMWQKWTAAPASEAG